MNRNFNKKALLASVLSLTLCFAMLLGTTFAWFTDKATTGANKIISGNLEVALLDEKDQSLENSTTLFRDKNGNTENLLWEPNATFKTQEIFVKNNGNLALKYKLILNIAGEEAAKLLEVVTVTVTMGGETVDITDFEGKLMPAAKSEAIVITTHMDQNADEKYENLKAALSLTVLATQLDAEFDSIDDQYDANAEYPVLPDLWDGTADTSWYDPDATEYTLDSAEDLAGLSALVNGDNPVTFAGKTVTLARDVDLSGQMFTPIGGFDKGEDGTWFEGVFDGQGHTIYGLTESGWDLGYAYGQTAGMGLFGVVYNSTIKNVVLDQAEISMEEVVMGGIAGYATGDCTFEDITVSNSQIANYNWDTGGIVGQVYGTDCTFTFKNITVDSSTTISGHWGTWDVSAGGVIGRTANGVKVEMENVTVACVLDVYNDVCAAYQWYAYRYSGMLVGYTKTTETVDGRTVATAPHVSCKDVTVIYDTWANYTYCQPSNVSPQYVREQGGYSTDPYYSGRHWTAGVDANGNKMVDANHVHAAGEAHSKLIVFDQLFGGGQGVYGTATHDGVTVIYNNK